MTTVRAKLSCTGVKLSKLEPYEVEERSYDTSGNPVTGTRLTWPRAFEFSAVYDASIPEDARYARYTPYAQLTLNVDNPAVSFEPGKSYYLDFTEAGSA